VIAVNSAGTASAASATATVNRTATTQQPVRINAGGGAVTVGGVAYAADSLFTGGKTYTNAAVTQIAGTTDDAIYLNERSSTANLGTFGYNIPLVNGAYTVRLHFAELFHGAPGGGAGGTGKRVFSVNLEGGATEVTNLDLNAQVAPATAYVVTRQISVTDGNLDVDFSATVNQPTISAIEVVPGTVAAPTPPAAPANVAAVASGANNSVTWNASATAVGYHVERATSTSGPWTRLTTTPVTGTTYSDTAGSTLQVAVYRVLAVNSAGLVSAPSATATVTRAAPVQPIRINTGGGAVTAGGVAWTADANFTGGKTYTNAQVTAIGGTTADAIYQNERSATTNLGAFAYHIPVPNGTYTVRLHNAELYWGATGGGAAGSGRRVFSVNFEGGAVEVPNRDVNAAVGPMNAYVTSHNVTVTGGVLDIDFAATADQPTISAIEVLPGANSTAPIPGGATVVVPPSSNTAGTPQNNALAPQAPVTSSPFQAPVVSSPFQAPAPGTPFSAPTVTTSAPSLFPGAVGILNGAQPFTAPVAPSVVAPAIDSAPVALAAPDVKNAVQPGEMELFGQEQLIVRTDVLAAFLLLMMVLGTVMLRRMNLLRQLQDLMERLVPRAVNQP
jgi:hypothetical protein